MGSLAIAYSTEVLNGYKLTGRASASYVGQTIDEAFFYNIRLGGYTIANARLNLARDSWSVALFVDNLTNKVYYSSLYQGWPTPAALRTVRMTLTSKF